MFIGASATLAILAIAENRHNCPPAASAEEKSDVARRQPVSSALSQSPSFGDDITHAMTADGKIDRLLLELTRKELELDHWLSSSETNASLFRKDPVAALRAANLGIPEEVFQELENVTSSILQKLKSRF